MHRWLVRRRASFTSGRSDMQRPLLAFLHSHCWHPPVRCLVAALHTIMSSLLIQGWRDVNNPYVTRCQPKTPRPSPGICFSQSYLSASGGLYMAFVVLE